MADKTDMSTRSALYGISSGDLVGELLTRGVLRQYGITVFVPGIVRARSEASDEAFQRYISAKLVKNLSEQAVMQGLVAFTEEDHSGDDTFAPNDRTYGASILTLDPNTDMD